MKPDPTSENNLIPASTNDDKKLSHFDVIEAFVSSGGEDIVLSGFQEELLHRIRYTDEKLRQGHGRFKRDEIAAMIKATFNVSRDTAYRYMTEAERIFSSSFPLNKQYEIGARIEFLKEKIRFAAADSDWKAVGMMERVLERYYVQYPDVKKMDVKKTLIMNVVQQFFDTPEATAANVAAMSLDDAIQYAEVIENDNEDVE